jgi:ketosteroid isomerase-like protein
MQTRTFIMALVSVVVLALGFSCSPGPGTQTTVDTADVEQEAAEWDRSFNAGELTILAALYAEDAVSMPFNAPTVRGRRALQAEFERLFRENDNVRHETFVDEVLATPEWAIERARYTLAYTPKAGGTPVVETGRHVMCRKWVDGRWQIVWEIFNTDQPVK